MAKKPAGTRKRSWKKIVLWVIVGLVVLFAVMQAVPFGRSHTNPAAANPFTWTSSDAEAIAKKSCYDCHSNETKWWWASNIAPFSWLFQADVNGGRENLNFSDYAGEPPVDEFTRVVDGGMPPFQYTLIHPSAKMTDAQKQTLIKGYADGMAAMNGGSGSGSDGGSGSTSTTAGNDAAAIAAINSACSSCHPAAPALSFRAGNAAEAKAMIDSMVQRGATLTSDQIQLLIAYYTR